MHNFVINIVVYIEIERIFQQHGCMLMSKQSALARSFILLHYVHRVKYQAVDDNIEQYVLFKTFVFKACLCKQMQFKKQCVACVRHIFFYAHCLLKVLIFMDLHNFLSFFKSLSLFCRSFYILCQIVQRLHLFFLISLYAFSVIFFSS